MRLGAIAFGLGTLIYSGLEFVHFFETSYDCSSWTAVTAVNPILQMIFTFMQMYYLFTHSKLNINKNKIIAKFGLMHLVATNCCIWIRTLVKESMKEITESSEFIKFYPPTSALLCLRTDLATNALSFPSNSWSSSDVKVRTWSLPRFLFLPCNKG